jgi:hypothetical protein
MSDVTDFVYMLVAWHNFFENIGLDINIIAPNNINWKKMKEVQNLCLNFSGDLLGFSIGFFESGRTDFPKAGYTLSARGNKERIGVELSSQAEEFVRQIRRNNSLISLLKEAGLFRTGENVVYLPTSSFDATYNVLLQNGLYVKNEPAYRAFMQEYAPDKLKHEVDSGEMSQEQYNDIESKIATLNAARNKYFKGTE